MVLTKLLKIDGTYCYLNMETVDMVNIKPAFYEVTVGQWDFEIDLAEAKIAAYITAAV